MDDMDQDPEEIPMDQVLAEIRQMLSAHTEAPDKPAEPVVEQNIIPSVEEPVSPPIPPVSPVADVRPIEADYFLLTPSMRCDLPPDSELSASVQKQTTRVLNKLQQQSAAGTLSPELENWLNAHLPTMIEKVLANQKK